MTPNVLIILTIALLAPLTGFGQNTSDNRTVNNMTVDISSVHRWFAKPEGERPMKHWQRLRVLRMNLPIDRFLQHCLVAMESGENKEMVIKNLPKPISSYFKGLAELDAKIEDFKQRIAEDKRQLAYYRSVWYNGGRVDTRTSLTSHRGKITYAVAENVHLSDYHAAQGQLSNDEHGLEFFQRVSEKEKRSNPPFGAVVSMFTGQKFRDFEIWDCGIMTR